MNYLIVKRLWKRKFILTTAGTFVLDIPGYSIAKTINYGIGIRTNYHTESNLTGFIAGVTLQEHPDELKSRLYDEYLLFWDNCGYDKKYGGFIWNLSKDGIPVDDEKYILCQGRAIWIYSFLYNNFGQTLNFWK